VAVIFYGSLDGIPLKLIAEVICRRRLAICGYRPSRIPT